MFKEGWRKDCQGRSLNGFPLVEDGESAQGSAVPENSGGNAEAKYTRGSVDGPRRMEDGHR